MRLILAFDPATDRATSALVGDGELLGERVSRASTLLADVDALVRQAGAHPRDVSGLAVGIGPGSFTGIRVGLAAARGLALALDVPAAGVSTLAALAAGAPGAMPVLDAKRREVFVPGPKAIAPAELEIEPGATYVGDGAVGYRVISRYVDAWHVMNVAVTAGYRRRGIARALLERLFEVTASDERRGYTLEVRVSNTGAIRLYDGLGFVARGVRRGYYTDNREDALIMWRDPVPGEKHEHEQAETG